MPWSPTRAFPHPLANIKMTGSGGDPQVANYLSYTLVEWMTWQGLMDVINKFRKSLDLEPVPISEGPNLATTLKIPFTYCWSPALVAKPMDWPAHIDVCGFFFRDPPEYTPAPELDAFLRAGPPPVYIGFGSIVIDDPKKLTSIILEAVESVGARAIISRGWSKLGDGDSPTALDGRVFYLGDCPHEWLFQKVSAVVHHGGAGTTACGLRYGRPTVVVPFFGDQPFWGSMIAAAGAGPDPIPHQSLTSENLAEAIEFCLSEEAATSAQTISRRMSRENGVAEAVRSFHRNLPLEGLKCDIIPEHPPVWLYRGKHRTLRLSKLAAEILIDHVKIDRHRLKLLKTKEIIIENQRWDPLTGFTSSFISTIGNLTFAAADIVVEPVKSYQRAAKEQQQQSLPPAAGAAPPPSRSSSRPPTPPSPIPSSSSRWAPPPPPPPPPPSEAWTDPGPSASSSATSTATSSRSRRVLYPLGAAAAGGASSVGKVVSTWTKGILVDIPLATAEGLRAVPKLYGEEVREYGPIVDWKSGAAMAGKHFAYGMTEGIAGIALEPIRGAREGGAIGAVKGFGKGVGAFASQTSSAMVGIVAYPGQGIYKSLHTLARASTRKTVVAARLGEGEYMLRNLPSDVAASKVRSVLDAFDRWRAGDGLAET